MKQPAGERRSVFIGSSTEDLPTARLIAEMLKGVAKVNVWESSTFRPMEGTLERLEEIKHRFDYAIFVMTPHDKAAIRSRKFMIVRDNVLFELGLFMGALGRWRVFIVRPAGTKNERIPDDLQGITALTFPLNNDKVDRASLKILCKGIKDQMAQNSHPTNHSLDGSAGDVRFWHSIADRQTHHRDVRPLIAKCKTRCIVTGVALTFLVKSCQSELIGCLDRGVSVCLVISEESEDLYKYYNLYTTMPESSIPTAHKLYDQFFKGLTQRQRRYFSLYKASAPMAHSIGLYDDECYVSLFCIGQPSIDSPSFMSKPGSKTYSVAKRELSTLISKSSLQLGFVQSSVVKYLEGR